MEIGKILREIDVRPEPFELPDPLDAPAEDQPDFEPQPQEAPGVPVLVPV